MTTEGKSHGIVLAVTGVGELQLAGQGGEECAWRSKSIDAKGVVWTIVVGPLTVVNNAGRQGLKVEVAHSV